MPSPRAGSITDTDSARSTRPTGIESAPARRARMASRSGTCLIILLLHGSSRRGSVVARSVQSYQRTSRLTDPAALGESRDREKAAPRAARAACPRTERRGAGGALPGPVAWRRKPQGKGRAASPSAEDRATQALGRDESRREGCQYDRSARARQAGGADCQRTVKPAPFASTLPRVPPTNRPLAWPGRPSTGLTAHERANRPSISACCSLSPWGQVWDTAGRPSSEARIPAGKASDQLARPITAARGEKIARPASNS